MAVLAYLGGVQPSEYKAMPWDEARALAKRIVDLHRSARKEQDDLQVALMKGQTSVLARAITAIAGRGF